MGTRITILVGHSVAEPLPEAIELAQAAANDFLRSSLSVDLRIDVASVGNLRREAARGCDVLVYYGHGARGGQLLFTDGPLTWEEVAGGVLASFWADLPVCLIFACHGTAFATDLPCPWVSFDSPILRDAPKGFMHALVRALAGDALSAAVAAATHACSTAMDSTFLNALNVSASPLPELRLAIGETKLSRGSPRLFGRYLVDFHRADAGPGRFSDHEPFVGRTAELRAMLDVPSPYSDRSLQKVFWVYGGAGMGKSALLRQFAAQAGELLFDEHDEPAYVLHLYCWRANRAEVLERLLCQRASVLYGLKTVPDSVSALIEKLKHLGGVHVWVLDDLSYFLTAGDARSTADAASFVERIMVSAWEAAVPLQVVVSSRREKPERYGAWHGVRVKPLNEEEAIELAQLVLRQAERTESEADWFDGARELFRRSRAHVGSFKRNLLLAIDQKLPFRRYADLMTQSGTLEETESADALREMLRFDVEQLTSLEEKHCFRYRTFFGVYYALLKRAGWFSAAELSEWFGERFVRGPVRDTRLTYDNALRNLVRLNLAVDAYHIGVDIFGLPPNQWPAVAAFSATDELLPPGVPARGHLERLALAHERFVCGDMLAALHDLDQLLEDYGAIAEPDVLGSLALALGQKAEILSSLDRHADAVQACEEFAQMAESAELRDLAITAYLMRIDSLLALNRGADALASADDVRSRLTDLLGPRIGELRAETMFNRARALARLGRTDEALATYDEVVALAAGGNVALVEKAAKALFNAALLHSSRGDTTREMAAYDQIVQLVWNRDEPALLERGIKALNNKGTIFMRFGDHAAALAAWDAVITRTAGRSELGLVRRAANALVNKVGTLLTLGRIDDGIAASDALVQLATSHEDSHLAKTMAVVLMERGEMLDYLRRPAEAIVAYDELIARFTERREPNLRTFCANAHYHKVLALVRMGRASEALDVCKRIYQRFASDDTPEIVAIVTNAETVLRATGLRK